MQFLNTSNLQVFATTHIHTYNTTTTTTIRPACRFSCVGNHFYLWNIFAPDRFGGDGIFVYPQNPSCQQKNYRWCRLAVITASRQFKEMCKQLGHPCLHHPFSYPWKLELSNLFIVSMVCNRENNVA